MTTDTKATYYDLDINGATIETRDIVRAVLERAGLGADASHQLGKLLERAIRLGAKPGTDVGRECEKIAIEAGMLRDAAPAEPMPVEDVTAGYRVRVAELEREREAIGKALPARLLRLSDRSLPELVECLVVDLAQVERERDTWRDSSAHWWKVATCDDGAARERAEKAERELAALRATLKKNREASIARAEGLEMEIELLRSDLAVLRDRYRPRRQSEEPAPKHRVFVWDAFNNYWNSAYGGIVTDDAWWTHQPPAPEAEREGE